MRAVRSWEGSEMSVAVSQRLQELRRRLAASENLEVITDVRRAARRFAERTDLREAFAMLVAGCDEKRRRIRAASATQRQALAAGCAFTMSPGIEMKIGAWAIDEFGHRSRVIWNAADGRRRHEVEGGNVPADVWPLPGPRASM
jgi:hypothetical protein